MARALNESTACRRHHVGPIPRQFTHGMAGFPFLSDTRFLQLPVAEPRHPYVVAGLPWDGSVTNRPGARFGPRAIRTASHMLCDATHPLFDVSPIGQAGDAGDIVLPHASHAAMQQAIQAAAIRLLGRHHTVWLGGDHSVTLPILRALRQRHARPLALLHFDAHCDTWPDHFGEPSGHGTWVREAVLEGLVDPRATVQVGIRSAAERSARDFVVDRGGQVWTSRALRGLDGSMALAPIEAEIRRCLSGGRPGDPPPVYLSLDIDVIDPGFAPGTGTPEPGGLSTSQVLTLLEDLFDLPFVGMDCVEVSPPYDHAELTASVAATLVWTYLCGRIRSKKTPFAP